MTRAFGAKRRVLTRPLESLSWVSGLSWTSRNREFATEVQERTAEPWCTFLKSRCHRRGVLGLGRSPSELRVLSFGCHQVQAGRYSENRVRGESFRLRNRGGSSSTHSPLTLLKIHVTLNLQ